MKNILKKTLIITLTTVSIRMFSQDPTYDKDNLWNVIPPSPTVWSFTNVLRGNYVDKFTGRPNISIPIITLEGRELSLPISLNYSSSGVIVNNRGSWIGTDWSLNAGGNLSRVVIGKPDESINGYWTRSDQFPDNGSVPTLSQSEKSFAADGTYDYQPDQFKYNVSDGLSGTFYVKKNENIYKFYSVPTSDDKIQRSDESHWKVIDPNGTSYYFGSFAGYGAVELTSIDDEPGSIYRSAWHLLAIVSADTKDTINLYYNSNPTIETDDNYTEILKGNSMNPIECSANTFLQQNHSISHSTQYLERIETSKFIAKFIQSGQLRTDDNLPSCDTIKIYSKFYPDSLLHVFILNYNDTGKRFFLSSISHLNSMGQESEKYQFNYYSPENLPARNSFSVDHWGFFNGKSNAGLIPYDFYYLGRVGNADRSPDTSKVYTGMLKIVTFPTGGSLEYKYESNSYSKIGWQNVPNYELQPATINCAPTSSGTLEIPFHINVSQRVEIHFSLQNHNLPGEDDPEVYISNGADDVWRESSYAYRSETNYLWLDTGSYILGAIKIPNSSAQISLNYNNKVVIYPGTVGVNYGGGARVNNFVLKDNSKTVFSRHFQYVSPYLPSSGILQFLPNYSYSILEKHRSDNQQVWTYWNCSYQCFTSYSLRTIAYSRGNFVSYNYVKESIGEGQSGNQIYEFFNDPNINVAGFPYPPEISMDWKRGMPKSISTFNSSGSIIEKDKFDYDSLGTRKVSGIKVGTTTFSYDSQDPDISYTVEPYYYTSAAWIQTKQKKTSYFVNDTIVEEEAYSYNDALNHHKVVQKTKSLSSGDEELTKYKYTLDYSDGTLNELAGVITEMKQQNQVVPIEITTWIKNHNDSAFIVRGQLSTYRSESNIPFPDRIYSLELPKNLSTFIPSSITNGSFQMDTNYLKEKVLFQKYSDYGGLEQIKRNDEIQISYIWGYNKLYPVIKGENISYANLLSAVQSSLPIGFNSIEELLVMITGPDDSRWSQFNSSLRANNAIKHTIITTLTYKPPIGMTSQTDSDGIVTYFEYDGFGRLETILDNNRNVLRHISYNYSSPLAIRIDPI